MIDNATTPLPVRRRVVVAEDHLEMRRRIGAILSPDHEIVAEVGDGAAALEAVRRTRPDVLLLDISMPGMSGFFVLRQLAREAIKAPVIVVTCHREAAYVEAARRAGAAAYVLKTEMASELRAAVTAACEGKSRRFSVEFRVS